MKHATRTDFVGSIIFGAWIGPLVANFVALAVHIHRLKSAGEEYVMIPEGVQLMYTLVGIPLGAAVSFLTVVILRKTRWAHRIVVGEGILCLIMFLLALVEIVRQLV